MHRLHRLTACLLGAMIALGGLSVWQPANAAAGPVEQAATATQGMVAQGRTVSVDVKNADVVDVLRLLAQESGQNIVATQGAKGTITVSLQNVPLRTALVKREMAH